LLAIGFCKSGEFSSARVGNSALQLWVILSYTKQVTLADEIESLLLDIENNIQIFFIHYKRKKYKTSTNDAYDYEIGNYKSTDLYTCFLKVDQPPEKFGGFLECEHCDHSTKCELNEIE
jgi:hypothetical protein